MIFYYILPWLNYGDANTKFFPLKTLQNRSQSRITTLKDSTRLWVSEDMLTTHITVVFTKLFTSTSPHTVSHSPLVRYYHQNNPLLEQHQRLSSTPSPEEIYQKCFFTPPFKSTRSGWIPCNFLSTKLAHSCTWHYSCHSRNF